MQKLPGACASEWGKKKQQQTLFVNKTINKLFSSYEERQMIESYIEVQLF